MELLSDVLLKNLKDCLTENNYHYVRALPLRKYSFCRDLVLNECFNFFRFALRKGNTFGISFSPELYEFVFKKIYSETFLLYELFIKNTAIAKEEGIIKILGRALYDQMLDEMVIFEVGDKGAIGSKIRVVPCGRHLYITDRWDRKIENFVYLSYDSLVFAKILKKLIGAKIYKRMLDVGCGSGILTIELSKTANHSTGIDLNNRAVNYARLNAKLNDDRSFVDKKVEFYCKNVFDINGRYDLIISNPPFVFLDDETMKKDSWIDSNGGYLGIEFTIKLLEFIPDILEYDGTAIIFSNAPIRDSGEDVLYEKIVGLRSNNFNLSYIYISKNRYFTPTNLEARLGIKEYKIVMIILRSSEVSSIRRKYDWYSIFTHKF